MHIKAMQFARVNRFFKTSSQTLIHQNENEGGERVTLENSSRGNEGRRMRPIDQNGEEG
jgi:hypothetical protein